MTKAAAKALADNLKLLSGDKKRGLTSQPKIAERAKVGQRTVGRAMKGEVSTTLASIEAIAQAFGLPAWQLLHPTLGHMPPGDYNDPMLFDFINLFSKLSADSKHEVAAHVNHLMALEYPGKTASAPFNGVPMPSTTNDKTNPDLKVAARQRPK